MNIKEFLNLVKKYKWLIVAIVAITLLLTFFFVQSRPREYRSEAKLSTGLLDPSKQVAPEVPVYSGPDIMLKLNQQFTNIMDAMRMSKNISILSYRLILHDLKNPSEPFRSLSNDLKSLNDAQRQQAISLFEQRLIARQVLTPLDNNSSLKLFDLVKSMGYDEKTLTKGLDISHETNSDLITIAFTSDNTFLSVFVVNTFAHDFISNYNLDIVDNKNSSITVLDSLLRKKEIVMNERLAELKDYKVRNGVLNLDKQSQIVYQQITDIENKKSQALVDKQGFQAALKNVNDNLNNRNNDKFLGANVSKDNQAIINLKNRVSAAENTYLDNGYKTSDKKKVDSLQMLLNAQLVKSNDNYLSDPLVAKQTLIQRRIAIGIDLDKANAGINDLDKELGKLNAKFNGMVPFDAGVKDFERKADLATNEYLEILAKYNQTSLDKNIGLTLKVTEEGVSTPPESGKKALFMTLSAVASLAICFVVLFLIFLIDHSINDETGLKATTNGKIIGKLNFIKPKDRDIDKIWKGEYGNKDHVNYKNLLRKTRFELNELLSTNQNILGISSLSSEKSVAFTTTSLAYAFASLNKKVLVIGGDDLLESIAQLGVSTTQSIKDVFADAVVQKSKLITFLHKDLDRQSLFEHKERNLIETTFNKFKSEFDLIILSLDPIDTISDNEEWLSFTDKYIVSFVAGNSITEADKVKTSALNGDSKFGGWLLTGVKQ